MKKKVAKKVTKKDNTVINEVTFYSTEQVINYYTGKKEDYLFETRINGPMFQQNIIVKIISTSELGMNITYDMYILGMDNYDCRKPTLADSLLCYHILTKPLIRYDENEVWICKDTNEKTTLKKVHKEYKEAMEEEYKELKESMETEQE